MRRLVSLSRSLIGKKIIMAASGMVLLGFVIGHLVGNLKVFEGPDKFNAYAEGLRTLGAPFFARGQLLWIVRIALLASVGAHVWAATLVTWASWRARPAGYHRLDAVETSYAARTMRWGGMVILAYVVYHLLDLTFGSANPAFQPGNVHHNLVASFQRWPVAAIYSVAMLAVGLHVYHGLWSGFQTLGLNHAPSDRWRRSVAGVIAGAITVGYLSIPVAVLAGWLR
jgi:succinate dehydrogenase / fumarate reductase, cytochrome b subunit